MNTKLPPHDPTASPGSLLHCCPCTRVCAQQSSLQWQWGAAPSWARGTVSICELSALVQSHSPSCYKLPSRTGRLQGGLTFPSPGPTPPALSLSLQESCSNLLGTLVTFLWARLRVLLLGAPGLDAGKNKAEKGRELHQPPTLTPAAPFLPPCTGVGASSAAQFHFKCETTENLAAAARVVCLPDVLGSPGTAVSLRPTQVCVNLRHFWALLG